MRFKRYYFIYLRNKMGLIAKYMVTQERETALLYAQNTEYKSPYVQPCPSLESVSQY